MIDLVGFAKELVTPLLRDKAKRNYRIIRLAKDCGMPFFVLEPNSDFEQVYAHTLVAYCDYILENQQNLNDLNWVLLWASDAITQHTKTYFSTYVDAQQTPPTELIQQVLQYLQTDPIQQQYFPDIKDEEVAKQTEKFRALFHETTHKSRTPADAQAYNLQYMLCYRLDELKDAIAQDNAFLREQLEAIHEFLHFLHIRQTEILDLIKRQSIEEIQKYAIAYHNSISGDNNVILIDSNNNTIHIDALIQPIIVFLQNPKALKTTALANYRLSLQTLFNDYVLNDTTMTLADVYIPPHFAIHRINIFDEEIECNEHGFYSLPQNPLLHDLVDTLLPANAERNRLPDAECIKQHDAKLILLLGDPGQGKSSFCKHLLHHCIADKPKQKIFFIPLRYVDKPHTWLNSPIESIVEQINNDLNNKYIPEGEKCEFVRNELNNALIVLDGLDELCMIENMEKREAEAFCKELLRQCRNASFKILVTSRYGYVDTTQLEKQDLLVLQLSPLSLEQQQTWLQKYRWFHPETPLTEDKLAKYNKHEHLAELLNQAILLHIIATLQQDIVPSNNKDNIYQKLFNELCEANWKQSEGQLDKLQGMTPATLRDILQRIAFVIYENQQTYITQEQLEALSKEKTDFGKFVEYKGIDFSKTLLMASYIRRIYDKTKIIYQAIEFLHKSLQEYLTAEYIWQQLKDELCATQNKRGNKTTYTLQQTHELLKLCDRLFTPQSLLPEESVVKQCLVDIINSDQSPEKDTVRERLLYFWEKMIPYQFLYPPTDLSKPPSIVPSERICRTFYVYWLCLQPLHPQQDLQPKDKQLRRQMAELWRLLGFACPSPFNLLYQNLSDVDLSNVNLSGSNLRNADLSYSYLVNANLKNANLRNANLGNTILTNADLSHTDLKNANLSDARLINVTLRNAYLNNANLRNIDLKNADLSSANLKNANLTRANLTRANLTRANLTRANLTRADLQNTDLRSTNLNFANLIHADLRNANLSYANLSYVNLISANLYNTVVDRFDWFDYWMCDKSAPIGLADLAKKYTVKLMKQKIGTWIIPSYLIIER